MDGLSRPILVLGTRQRRDVTTPMPGVVLLRQVSLKADGTYAPGD